MLRLAQPWHAVAAWAGRAQLCVVRLVEPSRADLAHRAESSRADLAQLPLLVVAQSWPVAQELRSLAQPCCPVAKSVLGLAGRGGACCRVDQDAACCLVDQGVG